MLLLLDRIPKSEPTDLAIARFHSSSGTIKTYFILSIDTGRSFVRLRSTQDPQEVVIPVDALRMIWREPDSEIFHVSLHGTIVETSTRELQFYP